MAFSIAKKIKDEDVKKFFTKHRKSGKTDAQINNLLRDTIVNEIQSAILENKIPGLVGTQELAEKLGMSKSVIDDMPEVNRLIITIAHKLSEKKFDKMSLCHLIHSLVNLLELSEEDFEKFHSMRPDNDDDDDDEDDD